MAPARANMAVPREPRASIDGLRNFLWPGHSRAGADRLRSGAADDRGRNAIHHAVLKDFPYVVEFLVAQGARIDVRNERDLTPLQLAETVQGIPGTNGLRGTRPRVAEMLRRLGATE